MATTINYIHNPESSKQYGDFGEQYGQHVEPHGKYISEHNGHAPEGWESGSVTFHNPKHMDFGGSYREPSNWKHQLSSEYDGKRGRELSDALRADGHDGIITHDKYGTSEIVDLTHPKPARRRKASASGPLCHGRMPRRGAQERFRCPCGIPVEYDPQDGWQHADGSISHDGDLSGKSVSDLMDQRVKEKRHGREAGKGKPRHNAPDVARGADQAAQGPSSGMAPDPGRDDDGGKPPAPLRGLVEHPKVSRDVAKLPKNVQAAYHERVDGLRRGEQHSSTHALNSDLKKWQSTNLNYQYRMVHKTEGDTVHVLSAGNHDESYDQGARRLGRYTAPRERLFGRTFGLDSRLWDGEKLRPAVREDVIARFDAFCHVHGYEGWQRWAKIVFFGSEASEWTSKKLVGNGDFDLSIGIHYPALKATVPGFAGLTDEIIAAGLTQEMHAVLNDEQHRFLGVPGVFDQTWYANLQGWDIVRIRPYAAYDVVADEWIVKPPHLEDWSLKDFPEGPGMEEAVRGIIELAEGYLAMPEPHRTQNGAALWEFVHSNRSDAFGENGEGWWDMRNVIEKALDQKGLMQRLFECHRRATEHPESLASPSDWSNSPVAAR